MNAPDSVLRRWLRGPWYVACLGLLVLILGIYAAEGARHIYHLRLMLAGEHPGGSATVAIRSNTGQSQSATVEIPVGGHFVAVEVPIHISGLKTVEISLRNAGETWIGPSAIRTNFKVLFRPHVYRAILPEQMRVSGGVSERLPDGSPAWRLKSPGANGSADCIIEFSPPPDLGFAWFYFAYHFAALAFVACVAWIAFAEAAHAWLATRVWRSRLSPRSAVLLVAAASVVLSCYPVIFLGKSFVSVAFGDGPLLLYDDPATLPGMTNPQLDYGRGSDIYATSNAIVPYAMVEHRALFRDGELPLWDRYDEAGIALLGQGQSMFGDPLQLLVIAANGRSWAWDVKFVLAKWLFCTGVGLLVLATAECLPAAILLTFSSAFIGFFGFRLNHPAYFSVCYAPWILLAWVRLVKAPTWRSAMRWALGLMLANWMEMTSGTVKEAYMLLAALNGTGVLVFTISRLPPREKLQRLLGLGAAGGLFALLASPFLWAFCETLAKSGSSYDNPVVYQLQPALFVGLFDDIFFRQFNWSEGVLGPSLNACILFGVLLAAVVTSRLWNQRTFAALVIATLPSLGLVFGIIPPDWIRLLPLVRNIYHVDNTFSCVLLIQFLAIAGYGFAHVFRCPNRRWLRDAITALTLGAVLAATYFGAVNAQQRSNVLFEPAHQIEFSSFFCWYLPGVGLAFVALPFLLRRVSRERSSLAAWILLLGCLTVLHWRMGIQARNPWAAYTPVLPDRVDLLATSPALERLRSNDNEPFRAFGTGNVFSPGYGAMVDVESILGLDALWNPYINTLDAAALAATGATFTETEHLEHLVNQRRFHDLLGVRYYLTMPGKTLPDLERVTPVVTLDLTVYRNADAWPRAFFVDRLGVFQGVEDFADRVVSGDGRPIAEVDQQELATLLQVQGRFSGDQSGRTIVPATAYRLTNHRTSFQIEAPRPGVVVLMEPFVDGDVTAEANGHSLPVWRVNHAFRGVLLERAGRYEISFSYCPRGLRLTLVAAAVGAVLTGGAVWFVGRAPLRPSASAAHVAATSQSPSA